MFEFCMNWASNDSEPTELRICKYRIYQVLQEFYDTTDGILQKWTHFKLEAQDT